MWFRSCLGDDWSHFGLLQTCFKRSNQGICKVKPHRLTCIFSSIVINLDLIAFVSACCDFASQISMESKEGQRDEEDAVKSCESSGSCWFGTFGPISHGKSWWCCISTANNTLNWWAESRMGSSCFAYQLLLLSHLKWQGFWPFSWLQSV